MAGYEKNILYHYTDFQALDGILYHAQLRVNNVLNMNDAAEMRLFMSGLCHAMVKRLKEEGDLDRVEKIRKLFHDELKKEFFYSAYAACFSCSSPFRIFTTTTNISSASTTNAMANLF